MHHPSGKIAYTGELSFAGGPNVTRMPSYRTIDSAGREVEGAALPYPLDRVLATRLYTTMATLQTMDTLFYEAQRQGRFSFYLTSAGEEATVVGSAAALHDTQDWVFAQYREQGVLLWRGFTLRQFADQLLGNELEAGKGRQMPIHYGSAAHAYQTISSPLATQMPHAVGAGYALKLGGARAVTVAYFGEGASSEGDAHAAFNFAATLSVPCLFICRNNGYAISTPANEQFKGDGVAARGPMYGMSAVRVDGGDARAVYNAVRAARETAIAESRPMLIECMSYRSGHHSTSDDSTRYRTADEMRSWRSRDPVTRFRAWMEGQGWWAAGDEAALRTAARKQVLEALDAAACVPKNPLSTMFTDVYADVPWHLREQMQDTVEFASRHPGLLPPDVPIK